MTPIPIQQLPGIGDPIELTRRMAARGLIHYPLPEDPNQKVELPVFNVIDESSGARGEVPLYDWLDAEVRASGGLRRSAVYMRLVRGRYPGVKLRRVNRRLAFVVEAK